MLTKPQHAKTCCFCFSSTFINDRSKIPEVMKAESCCILISDIKLIKELEKAEFPPLAVKKFTVKNVEYALIVSSKASNEKLLYPTLEQIQTGYTS